MSINIDRLETATARHLPSFGAALAFPEAAGRSATREETHHREAEPLSGFPAIGVALEFGRNQTVFTDGDPAHFFYKVTSGAVRLCKLFPDGRRQVAGFCFPGEYFGLAWQSDEYALTAEAASDSTVMRFRQSCLEDIERSPGARSQLVSLLCGELSLMQNHLLMLGRQTVRERVASFLLMMLDRQRLTARDGAVMDLHMGRQDIADYLGLTIETVCRTISDLKRARVIAVPGPREIVISNLRALRALADGEE